MIDMLWFTVYAFLCKYTEEAPYLSMYTCLANKADYDNLLFITIFLPLPYFPHYKH